MRAFSILILIAIFSTGFVSDSSEKMVKVTVREGVKVKLPQSFYKMPDRDILERYRSYKLPIAMYSSPDRLTEFGISISDNFWSGNDLELLLDFQKSNIMALYDRVKFLNQGIRKVHRHDMAYFELQSDTRYARSFEKKYTIVQYAVVDNRVLVFNFSCPIDQKEKWEKTAWKIMDSIRLKKSIF
jgi:hypothetical protein